VFSVSGGSCFTFRCCTVLTQISQQTKDHNRNGRNSQTDGPVLLRSHQVAVAAAVVAFESGTIAIPSASLIQIGTLSSRTTGMEVTLVVVLTLVTISSGNETSGASDIV
jgi:hypothetical protein